MFKLKHVVLTGATSGIGIETARLLLSEGANVIGIAVQLLHHSIHGMAIEFARFNRLDVPITNDVHRAYDRTSLPAARHLKITGERQECGNHDDRNIARWHVYFSRQSGSFPMSLQQAAIAGQAERCAVTDSNESRGTRIPLQCGYHTCCGNQVTRQRKSSGRLCERLHPTTVLRGVDVKRFSGQTAASQETRCDTGTHAPTSRHT